ncbi:MAG: hypothetical protein FJY88_06575 [Candidatus Eisenbacteria bacterium]|nr:hypothetical protein [Candidatus Eisenbacteria bacterium]
MRAELSPGDREKLAQQLGGRFTPAVPIQGKALFAGRREQVRRAIDAILQQGQHALIFGERGVGKTSLSMVLSEFLESVETVVAPRVNCSTGETYSSLWRQIFAGIRVSSTKRPAGFAPDSIQTIERLTDRMPDEIVPGLVQETLAEVGGHCVLIVIIDEYDRIQNQHARRCVADTVKALSDSSTRATLILVGVADSIDQLISDHQSIERALIQIQMPRMSKDELQEIIGKGFDGTPIEISGDARNYIVSLSQGLPHYTHLIALAAARSALDQGTTSVDLSHVDLAVRRAVKDAQHSIATAFQAAVFSPRAGTLHRDVLLACALCRHDAFGYFNAGEVRGPLSRIMHRDYDIPAYARHLNQFCDAPRGRILEKVGVPHRYRFRFSNPLMQPYVIMDGLARERLTEKELRLEGTSEQTLL